jgi:very-short-patch-repair endonuclease
MTSPGPTNRRIPSQAWRIIGDVVDPGSTNRLVGPPAVTGRAAIDARIARIAARQHGVITRRQLLDDVGLLAGAINRRLTGGQLVSVHLGVYRLPGPPAQLGWAMAAALAGGKGTVVSGRSAAAVHGIGDRGPRVEITSPRHCRQAAIQCHLARLSPDDVMNHLRVPVTTLGRTVFDIAAHGDCPGPRLASLVNQARILRPQLFNDLERLIARTRGPGSTPLAEIRLEPLLLDRNGPVRSVFEAKFRQALARTDLPPAQFNVMVAGLEVDALWPDAMVVVELDGRKYHGDHPAFERDRKRDSRLTARDYVVLRITWWRWHDEREAAMQELRRTIGSRTVWVARARAENSGPASFGCDPGRKTDTIASE